MPFLRRKKKQQEPSEPPLSFEQAVSRILFNGSEETVDTEEISFAEFETSVGPAGPGSALFAYGKSNELRFVLIEPGLSERSDRESRAATRGRLASFLSLDPARISLSPANAADAVAPYLLVEKPFEPGMRETVLWQTAECAIFRCPRSAGEGYLAVDRGRETHLKKELDENEGFRRFVRESIDSNGVEGNAPGRIAGAPNEPEGSGPSPAAPDRIDLVRPLDFLIGYALLPRRAPVGKKTAEVRFESLEGPVSGKTAASGGTASDVDAAEEVWFTYTCRFAAGTGPVYYAVPVRAKTEAHTKYFSALLSALVKYAAGFTRREIGPIKAGGRISSPPKDSTLQGAVRIDARISVEDKIFPVRIYVTPAFIGAAREALEARDREAKSDGTAESSAAMVGLLSLNLSLLMRGVEGVDRAGVFAEPTELLRVSELLSLLGPEDSRKVVQNFFLARGWKIGELSRLFYYRTGAVKGGEGSDKAKPQLIKDPQFRKEYFLPLLPRNLREEWNPRSGYSESRGELYAANRLAVEEISEAVESDRLILSYGGRYLLRRAVRERVDAGYKKRVEQIVQKGFVAKLLDALSKPAAQRTVSAFPSEDLARILLSDPGSIETLAPFISKNKRRDVEEQHRLLEADFERGKLSFHSIYKSLYTLLTELKTAREKEEELQ